MEQKTTLVFREYQNVTVLNTAPYFTRIKFPKDQKYILSATKKDYNTGYVIGAFNCTPDQDVNYPRIIRGFSCGFIMTTCLLPRYGTSYKTAPISPQSPSSASGSHKYNVLEAKP